MKYDDQKIVRIPNMIWGLGCAVFFVNLSSVMVRSLVAAYMRSILGLGAGWIGLVEGLVEGLSFILKMLSGVISDYLRRRKAIILIGYILMMISRPMMAVFSTIYTVILARVLDRLGNGIQATPRDALVGDIAPASIRGACYGLRIGLGTAGSFAGAFVALILMHVSEADYQHVFFMATIPAFLSVLIVTFFIREPEKNLHPVDEQPRHPIKWSDAPRLGRSFWMLMIVVGIFMIAQLGEAIMVLHAHHNFGLEDKNVPLILLIYNSTYSTGSYPAGMLSDRFSRLTVLAVGFVSLIFSDLFLGIATNISMVYIGVALSGLQMAITQSVFMTLVADTVPDDLRGTGFGVYYVVCAISVIISNASAGRIAEYFNDESYAFFVSMVVAIVALLLLGFYALRQKYDTKSVIVSSKVL